MPATAASCASRLSRREGARAVGAVAVEPRAPVADDERVRLDCPVAGLGMWLGAVRARCDRGLECELIGAVCVQELTHPPGDLALAVADPRLSRERLERAVGDQGNTADLLDLACVLHGTQPFDEARRRHQLERAGGKACVLRERQRVGLEGELTAQLLGEIAQERPLRQLGFDPGGLTSRIDVAKVREQARRAAGRDEQRGVRALEPRQVRDVDQVRDQQRLLEQALQPFDAGAHATASDRNTSASR